MSAPFIHARCHSTVCSTASCNDQRGRQPSSERARALSSSSTSDFQEDHLPTLHARLEPLAPLPGRGISQVADANSTASIWAKIPCFGKLLPFRCKQALSKQG